MGTSPKTKSEIRKEIANLRGQLARQRAQYSVARRHPREMNVESYRHNIASIQERIYKLQAKLPDAPK